MTQIINSFREQRRRGQAQPFADGPRLPWNRPAPTRINSDPAQAAASRARQVEADSAERQAAIRKAERLVRSLTYACSGVKYSLRLAKARVKLAAAKAHLKQLQSGLTPSGTNTET